MKTKKTRKGRLISFPFFLINIERAKSSGLNESSCNAIALDLTNPDLTNSVGSFWEC